MKILLVHPENSLDSVRSQDGWDLVIDLGWAGEHAYREWSRRLGCPVRGFYGFGWGPEDFLRVAEILNPCRGILVDADGLDWWEILAPLRIQEMLQLVLARRVKSEVRATELVGTRLHPIAELLARVTGLEIRYLETRAEPVWRGRVRRWRTALRRMTPGDLLQVALDKWDADYRLRSRLARRAAGGSGAVLLPSGYINVTRVLQAYARLLPEREFLLVTTRKSGTMVGLPENVRSVSLAGYAGELSDAAQGEARNLERAWVRLEHGPLRAGEKIALAHQSGWFGEIGRTFGRWLRIRDAWKCVLDKEHISAVLCGDENSPTNRIPLLLAGRRELPTVHCDHGSLNILLPLRGLACDHYLVKGEMERDFVARTFPVAAGRIVVGAPPASSGGSADANAKRGTGPGTGGSGTIVFFSEQHELTLGRIRVLYEELLPGLCDLARRHGTRVTVKLHPFESPASRGRLLDAVLSAEQRGLVDLVHGPLTDALLADMWFGVTVESSVAVDCTIRGIPCFVCQWFAQPLTGYIDQFVRYGAGFGLASPEEIAGIPERLAGARITEEIRLGLWNVIEPARLDGLLQKS